MDSIINAINLSFDVFILMLARVTALMLASPIFGRKNIPNTMKIALSVVVTYVVFISINQAVPLKYNGLIDFGVWVIKETLFGLMLGYVTTLFFSAVQTAGQVMDMQMGFGMVNVFDVQNNINIPITGNLLYIILLITFFAVNGHLQLIQIMVATFSVLPVGQVVFNPNLGLVVLQFFILTFMLALKVAMPMIAAGLLGEVLMGVLVRAIPQMNIFVVGIPLKIMLGFLMLLLMIPVYSHFCDTIFDQMFLSMQNMLTGMAR